MRHQSLNRNLSWLPFATSVRWPSRRLSEQEGQGQGEQETSAADGSSGRDRARRGHGNVRRPGPKPFGGEAGTNSSYKNAEARASKIPGTHEVRSTMRHQTHAYGVCHGVAIFLTFSPSDRDKWGKSEAKWAIRPLQGIHARGTTAGTSQIWRSTTCACLQSVLQRPSAQFHARFEW